MRELLFLAKDHILAPNDHLPDDSAANLQRERIETQALNIEIAPGHLLGHWLATSVGDFYELQRRIAKEKPWQWPGSRPHGIAILTASEIIGKEIRFGEAARPLTVAGQSATARNAKGISWRLW